MRIAVLEDEPELGAHIQGLMEKVGHTTVVFQTGGAALEAFRQESFGLLLLDWVLPDMSGIEVLAWTREHLDPPPPVIMVTARVDGADIVIGLDAGADDYVTKPVQDDILMARVEAVLRRAYAGTRASESEIYGDYVLDQKRRTVTLGGSAIETTDKEFALALLLFRNLERPLSRGYIMQTVWGAAPDTASRTLDAHVSQIRNRLDLRPKNGLRLSSVYGFGYRMESVNKTA